MSSERDATVRAAAVSASSQSVIPDLLLPLTVLAFFLHMDNFLSRMLLLSFLAMSVFWCWPVMSGIIRSLQPLPLAQRKVIYQEEGTAGITRYYEGLQAGSVAFQAFSLFVLTHVFFVFGTALGENINFSVHPFAGRIGLKDYDLFPNFSAVLMVFHKYILFVISTVAAFVMIRFPWPPYTASSTLSQLKQHEDGLSNSFENQLHLGWFLRHGLLTIALFFTMMNVGLYIQTLAPSKGLPVEEAISFTGLYGSMGLIYSLLYLGRLLLRSVSSVPKLLPSLRV